MLTQVGTMSGTTFTLCRYSILINGVVIYIRVEGCGQPDQDNEV